MLQPGGWRSGDLKSKVRLAATSAATTAFGTDGLALSIPGGSTDKWDAAGTWFVSATDFTLEVLVSMTTAPSFANVFGVSDEVLPGVTASAKKRMFLCFGGIGNGDIYFWGDGADLDSGVSWRTDGSLQHVFCTATGGTMRFYRDGVQIATGATPALGVASGTSYLVVGSRHTGGTATPAMKIFKASVRSRALSALEVARLTLSPWSEFTSLRRISWSAAADILMPQAIL